MKPNNIRINVMAACGVYSGACPSFNKTCKGCMILEKENK